MKTMLIIKKEKITVYEIDLKNKEILSEKELPTTDEAGRYVDKAGYAKNVFLPAGIEHRKLAKEMIAGDNPISGVSYFAANPYDIEIDGNTGEDYIKRLYVAYDVAKGQ